MMAFEDCFVLFADIGRDLGVRLTTVLQHPCLVHVVQQVCEPYLRDVRRLLLFIKFPLLFKLPLLVLSWLSAGDFNQFG